MPARTKARRTIVEMPVEDSTNGWHGASERKEDPGDGNFWPNLVQILQYRIADVLRKGSFASLRPLPQNAQAALLPVYVVDGQPHDVSRP